MTETEFHRPVMVSEVLKHLRADRGGIYVDGTVGGGGHARRIAGCLSDDDYLLGIDLDAGAIEAAAKMLAGLPPTVELVRDNFKNLPGILSRRGIEEIDGCLLDLGVSWHQLDRPSRGFTYRDCAAPLDMRMDVDGDITAADVLNEYDHADLARIFREYGEERWADRIAEFVARRRGKKPFAAAGDLVQAVKDAIPAAARRRGGHPARRTFQALRIEVNRELEGLSELLEKMIWLLRAGGRFVVLTFHSLEDRIVKRVFRDMAQSCSCPVDLPVCICDGPVVRDLTRRPLTAGCDEVQDNPRSSSAKLRAVERI